jgi:hypothetical protein
MNLAELYAQVPAEKHNDIIVSGDRVFVKDSDGYVDEYLISDEELWLVHSDRELKQDIEAIKSKLGI